MVYFIACQDVVTFWHFNWYMGAGHTTVCPLLPIARVWTSYEVSFCRSIFLRSSFIEFRRVPLSSIELPHSFVQWHVRVLRIRITGSIQNAWKCVKLHKSSSVMPSDLQWQSTDQFSWWQWSNNLISGHTIWFPICWIQWIALDSIWGNVRLLITSKLLEKTFKSRPVLRCTDNWTSIRIAFSWFRSKWFYRNHFGHQGCSA